MTTTLSGILANAAKNDIAGITFVHPDNIEEHVSYRDLYTQAVKVLGVLQGKGLKEKDELVLQVEDNKTFLCIFWACVLGNIIPVPLSAGIQPEQKRKLFKVWACLSSPYIICDDTQLGKLHPGEDPALKPVYSYICERRITLKEIEDPPTEGRVIQPGEEDIAYVQFSSGSTGDPKGVSLTSENLICNVRDIIKSLAISDKDVLLSWMPLTHDMGMIGFHLTAVFRNINAVCIPTSLFVRRPLLWMNKTAYHKASVLYSPNFGLQYFMSALNPLAANNWDLSCVRIIVNGAETISPGLCKEFTTALQPYGLHDTAILPAYGLAEAAVEVTAMPPFSKIKVHFLNRSFLKIEDTICIVAQDDPFSVGFVEVGAAAESCSLRICNDHDQVLAEGTIGHIQVKGKNVTRGYYNYPQATARAFTKDGWLRTGDTGFILNGHLTVIGRHKEIIILNGQNIYPQDIENLLVSAGLAALGKVVVAGVRNAVNDAEEIIVFLLHKGTKEELLTIGSAIREKLVQEMGITISYIVPVRKIPKTTSGKIQRFALKQRYLAGEYDKDVVAEKQTAAGNDGRLSAETVKQVIASLTAGGDALTSSTLPELGINSLTALQIVNRIYGLSGIYVPVQLMFRNWTIDELYRHIATGQQDTHHPVLQRTAASAAFPLSPAQERIWMECLINKRSTAYNIPVVYTINGQINCRKSEAAFHLLIRKYEILRTSFELLQDQPRQRIHEWAPELFSVTFTDLRQEKISKKEIFSTCIQDVNAPFDLEKPSQFRLKLIQEADNRFWMVFVIHHILTDGWSLSRLLQEFCNVYNALTGDEQPLIQEAPFQFRDYVMWQKELAASAVYAAHKEYWLKELQHLPEPVSLFSIMGARPDDVPGAGHYRYLFPAAAVTCINKLAGKFETTPFCILMTLLQIILYRYTNRKDLLSAFEVTGRVSREIEQLYGHTLNTLCLRVQLEGSNRFTDVVALVKEKLSQALSHQLYPVEELMKNRAINKSTTGNTLFNILVLYQRFYDRDFVMQLQGTVMERKQVPVQDNFIDTLIEFTDVDEKPEMQIRYNASLYNLSQVKLFADHLHNLLLAVSADELKEIGKYNFLTDAEKEILLPAGYSLAEERMHLKLPVHLLFERRAFLTPNAIAVETEDETLSYKEVNERANTIARFINENYEIDPGDRIGFWVSRGVNVVVAMLAIMKSGAAYVPFDPECPAGRAERMIADSGMKCLLVDGRHYGKINMDAAIMTNIEEIPAATPAANPAVNTQVDHLAYVTYTSGSTGEPKGVMITHESLFNYVRQFIDYFGITENDIFIQQSSVAFDTIVEEIFPALCCSARICIAKRGAYDIEALLALIANRKATVLSTTPLVLNEINKQADDRIASLRMIISGGEVLRPSHIDQLIQLTIVYNTYGPAETTVCATYKKITSLQETALIGKPVRGYHVYILDENRKMMPLGRTGEICIEGGLARGYLNMPDLTRQKFIANPFNPNTRLYCTGDLGRFTGEGDLEYLGRCDNQVKVRGYRVELEEVERVLGQYADVITAVVVLGDPTDFLTAYLTVRKTFNEPAFRRHAGMHLPAYMIPARIKILDRMPLTTSGKIDRVWLAVDAATYTNTSREAGTPVLPQSKMEELLLNIWEEILGRNDFDVTQNFFDLGGHSIKAQQLQNRIYQELAVEIKLAEVFIYPTIQQLAGLIEHIEQQLYRYIDIP